MLPMDAMHIWQINGDMAECGGGLFVPLDSARARPMLSPAPRV